MKLTDADAVCSAAPRRPEVTKSPDKAILGELRLSTALRNVLEEVAPSNAQPGGEGPQELTLGLIISVTRERAFGVLMAFICLPFIQPIPLPMLSVPFGAAIMILGAQIAVRRHRPWLPARLARLKLPQKSGAAFIAFIAKMFRRLERIVRPRFLIMQNPVAMTLVGLALVVDGFLLLVLPGLPGSNMIPGWMALVKILGITEEDGVCLFIGTLLSGIAAAAGIVLLVMSWNRVLDWVQSWFALVC